MLQNRQKNSKHTTKRRNSNNGISKNVFIMGLVSLFNDIASEMVYPTAPIFLTSMLGVSVTIVGVIEGVADATGSIFKIIFGWISDKLQKRKPIVVVGYLLAVIAKIILALSYTWHLVFVSRFSDRLSKGIRTSARDALIAESSLKSKRGLSFGFHRTMDTLGAVIGPLSAILFIKIFNNNFHIIFFIAAVPAIIGVLLLVFFVKEKHKAPTAGHLPMFKIRGFGFPFVWFLIVSCIFAVGNSSDAFLILRAKNLGLSTILTVFTYVTFNVTYSFLATPAGILSDKIGAKKILFIGFMLFCVVYAAFGFVGHKQWMWLLFPMYGVYMALTVGIGKAYISKLVPTKNLGVAFGVYQTLTGICTLFASIIAGLLWTHVSVIAPFVFGGMMAFVAGVLFLRYIFK
jgi:MFS family permease